MKKDVYGKRNDKMMLYQWPEEEDHSDMEPKDITINAEDARRYY